PIKARSYAVEAPWLKTSRPKGFLPDTKGRCRRGARGAALPERLSRWENRAGWPPRRRRAASRSPSEGRRFASRADALPLEPSSTPGRGRRKSATGPKPAQTLRATRRKRRAAADWRAGMVLHSSAKSLRAWKETFASEVIFDFEKPIVLGKALAAAGRARLDEPGVDGHGEIRDRVVARLAGAVGYDGPVAARLRQAHRAERLRDRADLIEFDQ